MRGFKFFLLKHLFGCMLIFFVIIILFVAEVIDFYSDFETYARNNNILYSNPVQCVRESTVAPCFPTLSAISAIFSLSDSWPVGLFFKKTIY